MRSEYLPEYVNASNAFKESCDKHSTAQLYDLLYKLQKAKRNTSDDQILANVYTLLGFHRSAYELLKTLIDTNDTKAISKLYKYKAKAQSHGNNFIVKDVRTLRQRQDILQLTEDSFCLNEEDSIDKFQKYFLNSDIIVFNKKLSGDDVSIYLEKSLDLKSVKNNLIELIYWLADCKTNLIEFYNANMHQYSGQHADDDWYYCLEVYSLSIDIPDKDKVFIEVSGGDTFDLSHILDISFNGKKIFAIGYDG